MPELPDFELSARVPSAVESESGNSTVPPWCELILEVTPGTPITSWWAQRSTGGHELHITRAAGEALIDVLHQTLHPHYGRSIIECIWEELDIVMDRLMSGEPEPDGRDPGRAEGLAMALALFTNTYAPDLDAVRERAVERWESRQAAGA